MLSKRQQAARERREREARRAVDRHISTKKSASDSVERENANAKPNDGSGTGTETQETATTATAAGLDVYTMTPEETQPAEDKRVSVLRDVFQKKATDKAQKRISEKADALPDASKPFERIFQFRPFLSHCTKSALRTWVI